MKAQGQSDFPQSHRINLDNDDELEYWTDQLKVTGDELKEAIANVGNSLEAVKVYLNKA